MTIEFRPLRTKRLSVHLCEIANGDAIGLASIPETMYESQTTRFLQFVVEKAEQPTPNHVTDPRAWTVQERAFVVGHYMAHVLDSAPDFIVGEGKFSDYLKSSQDIKPVHPVGELGEDNWTLIPLIGAAAEAIEDLRGDIKALENRPGEYHWMLGCMAAQLRRDGDIVKVPDAVTDVDYVTWLRQRMEVFYKYPESDFVQLLMMYRAAVAATDHFFNMEISEDGIVFGANAASKESGAMLPPSRFPARTCLSDFAISMGGKPDK